MADVASARALVTAALRIDAGVFRVARTHVAITAAFPAIRVIIVVVIISIGPQLGLGFVVHPLDASTTDAIDAPVHAFFVITGVTKVGDVVLAPLASSGAPFEFFRLSSL